jgi:hypothetical protein
MSSPLRVNTSTSWGKRRVQQRVCTPRGKLRLNGGLKIWPSWFYSAILQTAQLYSGLSFTKKIRPIGGTTNNPCTQRLKMTGHTYVCCWKQASSLRCYLFNIFALWIFLRVTSRKKTLWGIYIHSYIIGSLLCFDDDKLQTYKKYFTAAEPDSQWWH